MTVSTSEIIIFCDGACSGNPGPGGWGSVIVEGELVRELGGRSPRTTNNQMELAAAIEALIAINGHPGEVSLYTDSVYVIRGITQWIWAWRQRGWKSAEGNDIANRDLWEKLFSVASARRKPNDMTWKYVRGHTDVPGNERVDEIAVAFSKSMPLSLYRGPLAEYPVAIHLIPKDTSLPDAKPKGQAATKAKVHSYLSLLGSKPERHSTWAECERRVKGQSGAKFKKTTSAEDEASVLRSWGYDPSDLK